MAIDTKGAAWSEHSTLYALPKALLGGTAAMRSAGQTYLSKGSAEPQGDYDYRLANTFLIDSYKRTLNYLTGQVFKKAPQLDQAASAEIDAWSEDVDRKGNNLPEDDASPLRAASASMGLTASATGELKMSGSGSASIALTVAPAELLGILDGVGSASISIVTNAPTLGAEASGTGAAGISMTATASILPTDDSAPARTASATISMSGVLVPYATGSMVGSTAEVTGTLTADQVATEVLAALHATTIPVDSRKIAGVTVGGSGTADDPWGPL